MMTVQALMNDVDELLSYIAIVKTPDVDAVRDRLEKSLYAARRQLGETEQRDQARHRFEAAQNSRRIHTVLRGCVAIGAAATLGALALAAFRPGPRRRRSQKR